MMMRHNTMMALNHSGHPSMIHKHISNSHRVTHKGLFIAQSLPVNNLLNNIPPSNTIEDGGKDTTCNLLKLVSSHKWVVLHVKSNVVHCVAK